MNGNSHKRTGRRRERGQAIVEYAIVFPIQLMLTLGVIQLAHLFVAKQVLEYGAYCGARAKLIGLTDAEARKAAIIPISKIAGVSGATMPDWIELPGWGTLPKSGAAREKTKREDGSEGIVFSTKTDAGTEIVECTIYHNYELSVPVGNLVAAGVGSVFLLDEGDVNREWGRAPHVRMRAYAALPRP